MDTACESLHHSFIIKYRWLDAGETPSRTLGNSCVSSVSSHRFTLPCIRLIVSVITTYGYELYLCYVRGELLDKLCFSASHLIRYWKMYNYVHMQCLCILCIFWEIKHLNLNLNFLCRIITSQIMQYFCFANYPCNLFSTDVVLTLSILTDQSENFVEYLNVFVKKLPTKVFLNVIVIFGYWDKIERAHCLVVYMYLTMSRLSLSYGCSNEAI